MAQDAPVNSGAGPRAEIARDRVARTQIKYHRWAKTDRIARFGDLFNRHIPPGLSTDGLVGGGSQNRHPRSAGVKQQSSKRDVPRRPFRRSRCGS